MTPRLEKRERPGGNLLRQQEDEPFRLLGPVVSWLKTVQKPGRSIIRLDASMEPAAGGGETETDTPTV